MGELVVSAAGPSEAAWLRRTAELPDWIVPVRAHVVVVAPHPDDETLGLGGALQQLHAAGGRLNLVVVTDGEASHPGTPDLAGRRRAELTGALRELGIAEGTHVHHLAVPDGHVGEHEGEVTRAVASLADADSLILGPHPDDGHGDHDAAGRATVRAAEAVGARAMAYPVWAWQWHDPTTTSLLARAVRIPLTTEQVTRKQAATAAYVSQVTDDLGAPIVPAHVLLQRLLRDHEVLVTMCA